ncbi:hypothetical protein [Rhizobium sp. BK176]|uniref:hypothetical protein n=1 Tax=Rhizobium sp. BK176 TaxID=2587071 RepID=UPI00216A8248|nr:hypothetical protein [Rhizobium sp. BK176]MCS4089813.1 hypothetical protein [Rhizobium sp. BK176]
MRQEAYDLIEAVRSLGIELNAAPGPKALKISTDADTFWARLVVVKRALDAFDRAGGTGIDVDAPAPDDKLKKALDAVLRLYELQGGNMEQVFTVVQEALEVEPVREDKAEKKKKGYVTLPVFAPNGIKKKATYSPRISLIPPMPGSVSLDDLRRLGFDVSYVEAISGNTLASDPHERNRPQPARGPAFGNM